MQFIKTKEKHANVFRFENLEGTPGESSKILISTTNDESIAISSEYFFQIGFSREITKKERFLLYSKYDIFQTEM